MGIFQEYVNSKGKIAKPVVNVDGDLTDPKTPPAAPVKGKPYVGKGGKKGSSKPLGDHGDAELKCMPDTLKTKLTKVKIPVSEQVELCSLMVDALLADHTIAEQFVSQAKENGLLGLLIAEMVQYRSTYSELAQVMANESFGEHFCTRLARAMQEEVAAPYSDSIDNEKPAEETPSNETAEDGQEEEPASPPLHPAAVLNMKKAMKRYMDAEEDDRIRQSGLERVFSPQHQHGGRIFYDPKEGQYYDKSTDMFLTQDQLPAFGLGPNSGPARPQSPMMR